MNILILNHYAGSPQYGMEFRPYYMGRELVKLGHQVSVIAADHSHLRRKNPRFPDDLHEEILDGVRYVWVKTPEYERNNLRRAWNILTYLRKVGRHAQAFAEVLQPDAVIASSTYPNDFALAKKIADFSGGRAYFEIHDLWPLSPMVLYGLKENNPLIRWLQKGEDEALSQSEKVLSILPAADQHIKERGFDPAKFIYVPNGIVPSDAEVPLSSSIHADAMEMLRQAGKFIVLYVGGFADANALEPFVLSGLHLDESVQLVLVGDGMQKEKMVELANRHNLQNVSFLPPISKSQVPALLKLADCLYIGAKRCALYQYGIGMNKLYDYMLSGRPVICGIDAANDPVSEAKCGLTIPPEDDKAIAKAVRAMRELRPEGRDILGYNGRQYVLAHHNYADLAKRFLAALQPEEKQSEKTASPIPNPGFPKDLLETPDKEKENDADMSL